jgi:hypothetical protein
MGFTDDGGGIGKPVTDEVFSYAHEVWIETSVRQTCLRS